MNAGLTDSQIVAVINGLAIIAGIEVDGSAAATVRTTRERKEAGEPYSSWPRVIRILGSEGRRLVREIAKWLNIDQRDSLSLDDFFAFLATHKYIHRPTRAFWEGAGVNGAVAPVDVGGKKIPATTWLDEHQAVHQITWAPGERELIEEMVMREGGFHPHEGGRIYNTYLAPELQPGDPDAAGLWLEHLNLIYPDEAEHILAWLAHCVQRPGEKINHALVLGGAPGIGKDALLEGVVQAVGPWNVGEVSPSIFSERFNPYLQNRILRVSEARDLGDSDRYAQYEHMKTVIAAPPQTLRVDAKYIGERRIPNVVCVLYTTNHPTGGLYLPADDRRHYVAWSDRQAGDFPVDYFEKLFQWYEDGGFGHVRAYLEAYDLSAFDAKAPPRKTEAFWTMVNAERLPEEGELADIIEILKEPPAVTLKMLYEAAMMHGRMVLFATLTGRKFRRQVPHLMRAAGYRHVLNSSAKDKCWVIGGRRQTVYARVHLSLQEQIAAAQKLSGIP